MRLNNLFNLMVVILFINGCRQSYIPQGYITPVNIPPGDTHLAPIPGRYIVIMNDRFEKPLIKSRRFKDDRLKQRDRNSKRRQEKIKALKSYLSAKQIKADKRDAFFSDLKVMAIIHIDATAAANLRLDTENISAVVQDVTVQINPIQQSITEGVDDPMRKWQTDPVTNINPIQQNDQEQILHDIDVATRTTKAVVAAGGSYLDGHRRKSVIWILDTGLDTNSVFLNCKKSLGAYFLGSSIQDGNGHGTFCAGVAAGRPVGTTASDSIRIGVSAGATVVPIKVLDDSGKGSWGSVLAGLDHVAQFSHKDDVVNLSLGAYDPANLNCNYPALVQAIDNVTLIKKNRKVFVTMSAGNDGRAGVHAGHNAPGCINQTHVFTTSSIGDVSTCATYANFGSPPVDFVTVGTRVFSLWANGTFRMASGTSVSSAILAGIIHAKGEAPSSTRTVNCNGSPYNIATWR